MTQHAPVDLKQLERRICSPSKTFLSEGVSMPAHRLLIHKDRGAKVLGVAHLDFRGKDEPHMAHCVTKSGKRIVWSDRLDDRLGAYILLDYLPSLGVEMDVLLTDDEEAGRSTAGEFVSPKDYNWLVMFDRHGTELVMYHYETKELCTLTEGFGFKVGSGSFSCIGKMDKLGVAGFNIGTGYYLEHSYNSYAILNEVEEQCAKFIPMFQQYKDIKLVHDPKIARRRGYNGYHGGYTEHYGGGRSDTWEEVSPGHWRMVKKEPPKENPYGSLTIEEADTKEFTQKELGLTPQELQKWNDEKDDAEKLSQKSLHRMTDEEFDEFCRGYSDMDEDDMAAADAAYHRMRKDF